MRSCCNIVVRNPEKRKDGFYLWKEIEQNKEKKLSTKDFPFKKGFPFLTNLFF